MPQSQTKLIDWPDLYLADLIQQFGIEKIAMALFSFPEFEPVIEDILVKRHVASMDSITIPSTSDYF